MAAVALVVSLGGVTTASSASAVVPCPTVVDGAVVPFPAPGTSVDCTGASLAGADLRGADLTGWIFDGADLRRADLTSATLLGADLISANLGGATLDKADLSYTSLVGTTLSGAVLTGATLHGARLQGVDLSGADLSTAHLAGLVTGTVTIVNGAPALAPGWDVREGLLLGPGVVFSGRVLQMGVLDGLDLSGADLSGSILEYASLNDVGLAGTDLRGTDLIGAQLTGATGITSALTNSITLWSRATCPDGKPSSTHDGTACDRPLDVAAPKAVVGAAPIFSRSNAFYVPTTFTDSGSGIASWRLLHRTSVSGGSTWSGWTTDTWSYDNPRSVAVSVQPGHRTCARFQVRDNAGNVVTVPGERCSDAVYDSTANSFFPDGRWTFTADRTYFEWSYESTKTRGAQISSARRLYVRQVGVVATTCPTCGAVAIYVGSTKVGTISLARKTTTWRAQLLLPRLSTRPYGVVRVVVTSRPGRLVRVDALAVTGA